MLNGILQTARKRVQYQALLGIYGLWESMYIRIAKWHDNGTCETVFRGLSADTET